MMPGPPGSGLRWGRVGGAAFLLVLVAAGVRLLPGTGLERLDIGAGFLLTLSPVALLIWWVVAGGGMGWELGMLTGGALVAGFVLSWSGWLGPALPCKVAAGAAAGTLLGRQMIRAWWLVAVAAVAVAVDAWSVFRGPTRMIVEEAPQVLDYLLLHFPVLGGGPLGSGLGLSDVAFTGLFTAGAFVTGLRPRGTFLALCLSLVVTMVLALALRMPLPALPLLSVAFLVVNAGPLLRGSQ